VNVELKVNATFIVRVFPDLLIEEPVPDSVHWLFDTVEADPGVTGASSAPPPSL
jgi:hypothetical protein